MKTETIPAGEPGGYQRAKEGRAMTHDTTADVVERLAKLLCDADTTSWKNTVDTQTRSDVAWGDMRDSTEPIYHEGISLGRDHYRTLARAIVNTVPPVAVTEAMIEAEGYDPYENAVYALIRMREESPLLSLAQDDDIAAEAIYTDALQRKFKGKAEVLAVEISDNATGAIRDAVAKVEGSAS